jgi:hypothetical protein
MSAVGVDHPPAAGEYFLQMAVAADALSCIMNGNSDATTASLRCRVLHRFDAARIVGARRLGLSLMNAIRLLGRAIPPGIGVALCGIIGGPV